MQVPGSLDLGPDGSVIVVEGHCLIGFVSKNHGTLNNTTNPGTGRPEELTNSLEIAHISFSLDHCAPEEVAAADDPSRGFVVDSTSATDDNMFRSVFCQVNG